MWQDLADPDGAMRFPRQPPDDVTTGIAWWTALLHLLLYSLGWPAPHRQLAAWDAAGRPRDDRRLAYIDDVWGERLDEILAWWWEAMGRDVPSDLAERLGLDRDLDDGPTPEAVRKWISEPPAARREGSPWFGGSDALHLTVHCKAPVELDDHKPHLLVGDPSRQIPRAVLQVDSYLGWYLHLHRLGANLPPSESGRSWRVDVVCRPTGWLGTYRLSRQTGRWFSGRHQTHTLGLHV